METRHPFPAKLRVAGREIDFARGVLCDLQGNPVEMRPQVWAVLKHLAQNADRVVTKDDLLSTVWPGLVVTDGSVTQAISDVRLALGDSEHRIVKTVPRRGYVLVREDAAARTEPADDAAPDRVGAWISIAVLAFTDLESNPPAQGLARGLALELLGELARNADLRVISHHSSFTFAGTDTPLAEIGAQLRSKYLVDGSVRRDGERLRISVELIDSSDGDILWAEHHRVTIDQLPAARDAIVRHIAGTLHTSARLAAMGRCLSRPPKTLDVYSMTLRAWMLWPKWRPELVREGRALLERAIAIDPDYAPALSSLVHLNETDGKLRLTGDFAPERAPECLAQARRAVELDPSSPESYRALARALSFMRDFDAALTFAERAVNLAPSNADMHYTLAWAHFELGHAEAAMTSIEDAIERVPVPNGWTHQLHAAVLWANHRLAEALRAADESTARLPHLWLPHIWRMLALAEMKRVDEARNAAARVRELAPWYSLEVVGTYRSERAVDLLERARAASIAAGIPPSPS